MNHCTTKPLPMKKNILLLCVLSLLVYSAAEAQVYENSWINYGQQYFKIKISQDGIYRINKNTLIFSGVPASANDPRKLQLFHNGQEEYIYVEGESDGVFDANDFVEFYGRKNDGSLDKNLYADSSWQPNPRYSLFTDTSVYFLTYSLTTNGKRVTSVNNSNYSAFTPAPYFIKESYAEQSTSYNRGMNNISIDYTESEGWGTNFGNYGGSHFPLTVNVNTSNVYTGGPNFDIQTSIGGVNDNPHYVTITFPGNNFHAPVSYLQTLNHYNFSVAPALFTSSATSFLFDVTGAIEYNALYYLSVKYPHTPSLENNSSFKMLVPDDPSGKTRYDFTNFNTGAGTPVLYDVTNHKRILLTPTGSTWQTLIDNDGSGSPKLCYISSQTAIQNVTAIYSINYRQGNPGYFNNFQNAAIDSAYFILSNRALWSQAQSYKIYRDGTTNNHAMLLDIDELYDQFAYGIQKHPLSIRNFTHFVLDKWTTVAPPENMFIIGKSISPADSRNDPALFATNMIPSWGVPTSDMLLTSGINGSLYDPKIPVGRICTRTGQEVNDYLHKVTEYEAAQAGQPQYWMKEILHFGGGDNALQQGLLAQYLDTFRVIMEDSLYGGHVTTYLKYSSNPILINLSDSLQTQIDSGVSIMTFFGHASGSGFDQSTDDPSEYSNHGRYPLVIANSCFAGDIHTSDKSISEKFVLAPEKAAIGFIASVGLGIPTSLYLYSRAFFDNASHKHYGASFGRLMQLAIQDIQVAGDENIKTVCHEMSLDGDPALKLNNWKKPDYSVTESNFHFTPIQVSTDMDTFSVNVSVRNLGRAVQDSFLVRVTRTFPDGVDSVFTFKKARCYYNDDTRIKMHVGGFAAAGINRFKVEVDIPDSVSEFNDYSNNTATTNLFIISNDIIPVYPPKYAIHPYSSVTLKASTANPLADVNTYVFEIDTVDLAIVDSTPGMQRSSMYRFTTVTDSGGVIEWQPPLALMDSVVYFWRVANDSIHVDPVNFKWQESSFMYIPGKTGWAQSHFYQFKNNGYENIRYDTAARKFDFVVNNKSLLVKTYGAPFIASQANETGYYFNSQPIEYNGCGASSAVMIAVFDSISLAPWSNCGVDYGQYNQYFVDYGQCGSSLVYGHYACGTRTRPDNYFVYHLLQPTEMHNLHRLLDSVPNGDYILAYSWFNDGYSFVDTTFHNNFTRLGFDLTSLQDFTPFIMFMKKGDPSTRAQVFGSLWSDTLQYTTLLSALWNRGNVNSELVGPSKNWQTLHWNQNAAENPTRDFVHLNIYGYNSGTSAWDTLATNIAFTAGSKDTTLSWISAATYPYLKLQTYTQDDSTRTPAQMKYWRVYYDGVPECAVNPNRSFYLHSNPLTEGDTLRMHIAFDNIGDLPMDSLGVNFYMYNAKHVKQVFPSKTLDSLRVGKYLIADLQVDSTFDFAGVNSLWVEANAPDGPHPQLEQYHFNNIAEIKFTVNRDYINPILDVTFDGIHILDGDIVSGKPNINVQLRDENQFLALNDTTNFKVYLRTPNSATPVRIYFSLPAYGQTMRFTPAILPKNSCRIDWNPILTEDGTYMLEVEATDRSKNESGLYNYKISFEVINKSTITEVLNYPNPFSTSTRFVFTLTGNEVPDYMKIQVMTVTGKVVREIMMSELGNIHVGRNITDYAWDGKDQYGDQLANGLYLYRVQSTINDESIEHRATDADKYFKKGWGKMYLMR